MPGTCASIDSDDAQTNTLLLLLLLLVQIRASLDRQGFDVERLVMNDFCKPTLYSLLCGNAMSVPVIGSVMQAAALQHVSVCFGHSLGNWKTNGRQPRFYTLPTLDLGGIIYAFLPHQSQTACLAVKHQRLYSGIGTKASFCLNSTGLMRSPERILIQNKIETA